MQYSNCGLTNVLYNLSIVSLSLVTIVLLIIPKVELAFLMLQHIALTASHSCALSLPSLFFPHSLSTPHLPFRMITRRQTNWSVVAWITSVSLFKQWHYEGISPSLLYISSLH